MRFTTLVGSLLLGALSLSVGGLALYARTLAEGPDEEIVFTREVSSELDAATLGRAMLNLSNWPDWHHFLEEAKRLDIRDEPMPMTYQRVERGAVVRLVFLPKQQKRRQFELKIEISAYEPDRLLEANLVEDRRGRLTALFSPLKWRIELLPRADGRPGTLLRATVTGRTASPRARALAGLARRILMNQIFYVDLQKLAEITQPRGVVLTPAAQQ